MIPLDPAGLEAAAKLARSCTPTAREDARLAEQIVRAYLAATPDPPKPPPPPLVELVLELEVDGSPYPIPASAVPAASPDERLREAAGALVVAAACAVCEPGPFHDNDDHLQWKLADAITATRAALAAADREKPKRNHAPWCEGGHGDRPCPAPPVPDEPKEKP